MKALAYRCCMLMIVIGTMMSTVQAAAVSIDAAVADTVSRIEAQWPIHQSAPDSKIKAYTGVLLVDGMMGIDFSVGYARSIYSGKAVNLNLEGITGYVFGGFSNHMGEGFMVATRLECLINWLLPFEYGLSYQYYVFTMSSKENLSLSKSQGGGSLFARLTIDEKWFFPDITPYKEDPDDLYKVD